MRRQLVSRMSTSTSTTKTFNVAIIGGGITGSCAASILTSFNKPRDSKHIEPRLHRKDIDTTHAWTDNVRIHVDLFDQGKNGVGGRTSHRRNRDNPDMRWDYGCQFFRADTAQFQKVVSNWMEKDVNLVSEWTGTFMSNTKSPAEDFFGLPSHPPFYVGRDGISSVSSGLIDQLQGDDLRVYTQTQVGRIERNHESQTWDLLDPDGSPVVGGSSGYDALVMTSAFFSQGVPIEFTTRVRDRAHARVPLYTAMIALDTERSDIPFDAVSLDHPVLWFASKMNSKLNHDLAQECWTLVSTPEYAVSQMQQNPAWTSDGTFIRPDTRAVTAGPGQALEEAFRETLSSGAFRNPNSNSIEIQLPRTSFCRAQRWGSAMACPRHLDTSSNTRTIISGLAYESARGPLAPTKVETPGPTFLSDEKLMLFQAGDMVSCYTPGLEGAAISGIDAAKSVLMSLFKQHQARL